MCDYASTAAFPLVINSVYEHSIILIWFKMYLMTRLEEPTTVHEQLICLSQFISFAILFNALPQTNKITLTHWPMWYVAVVFKI